MIYIHIPFCHRKCTYCAFYSVVSTAHLNEYLNALCREIEVREWPNQPIRTLYFGGGTPSLLSPSQLRQVVDALRRRFDLSQIEEATLECNPEDLTPEYIKALLELKLFNRLSIGIQSFNDNDLRTLNRRHSAAMAFEAVCNATEAGFDNISIDLIYGLPSQDIDGWQRNLDAVATLPKAVKHLSAYSLTVEPGTILSRQIEIGKVKPTSETTLIEQYNTLCNWALDNGFEQYEISNFARPVFHSRHNSRYWTREPYLGLGASAHSFDGNSRRWNTADIAKYIDSLANGDAEHGSETLTDTDAYNELVITSLRTTAGIPKASVDPKFYRHLTNAIKPFIANGLIRETSSGFEPTASGLLQADGIAASLMA